MASRFEMKAVKHDEWMHGKAERLSDNQFKGLSLSEVTVRLFLSCLFICCLLVCLLVCCV